MPRLRNRLRLGLVKQEKKEPSHAPQKRIEPEDNKLEHQGTEIERKVPRTSSGDSSKQGGKKQGKKLKLSSRRD